MFLKSDIFDGKMARLGWQHWRQKTVFDGKNCLEVQVLPKSQGRLGKESDIFSSAGKKVGVGRLLGRQLSLPQMTESRF